MKNSIRFLLYMTLTLVMIAFSSCSLIPAIEEAETPESQQAKKEMNIDDADIDDPSLKNEQDGADLTGVGMPESAFYGNWRAPSDQAQYLYGNVDLSINSDKTWKGNITDEDFEGTWTHDGSTLTIKDNEKIINYRLYFVTDGTLMLMDLDDPETMSIVLKRK